MRLFDHSLHFPANCKLVTGTISATTGKDVDAKTKCDLHHWLGGYVNFNISHPWLKDDPAMLRISNL